MRPEAVDSDAARPEFRGEEAGEGFGGRASDAVAEEPRSRHARPGRRQGPLDEVANAAAFLASDHAGAMTAAIANLSCGTLVD